MSSLTCFYLLLHLHIDVDLLVGSMKYYLLSSTGIFSSEVPISGLVVILITYVNDYFDVMYEYTYVIYL